MMQPIQNDRVKCLIGLPALGAVLALVVAYGSQWFFGMHPCEMCVWQRIPYAVIIALFVMCWGARGRGWKWVVALMVLLLVSEVALAFYHAGVEWHWWEGMTSCSMGLGQGLSAEEMLNRIMNAAIVSCVEPPFRFLGLSMAGWNGVYALALLVIMAMMWKKEASFEK